MPAMSVDDLIAELKRRNLSPEDREGIDDFINPWQDWPTSKQALEELKDKTLLLKLSETRHGSAMQTAVITGAPGSVIVVVGGVFLFDLPRVKILGYRVLENLKKDE